MMISTYITANLSMMVWWAWDKLQKTPKYTMDIMLISYLETAIIVIRCGYAAKLIVLS